MEPEASRRRSRWLILLLGVAGSVLGLALAVRALPAFLMEGKRTGYEGAARSELARVHRALSGVNSNGPLNEAELMRLAGVDDRVHMAYRFTLELKKPGWVCFASPVHASWQHYLVTESGTIVGSQGQAELFHAPDLVGDK